MDALPPAAQAMARRLLQHPRCTSDALLVFAEALEEHADAAAARDETEAAVTARRVAAVMRGAAPLYADARGGSSTQSPEPSTAELAARLMRRFPEMPFALLDRLAEETSPSAGGRLLHTLAIAALEVRAAACAAGLPPSGCAGASR